MKLSATQTIVAILAKMNAAVPYIVVQENEEEVRNEAR